MNPLILEAFRRMWPYLIVAGLGFGAAWYIQGLRIVSAKQELVSFKQQAREALQDEKDRQQEIAEKTDEDWHKNLDALHEYYRKRMLPQASGGGVTLPGTPGLANGAGQDAVPAPARVAEDCAETTLQLNSIQDWIVRLRK